MRIRLLFLRLLPAVMACGSLSAQDNGRPSASTPVTGTNTAAASVRPDGLKRLEAELFRPLQPLSSGNPLDIATAPGLRLPAPLPMPESKRVKEMLERRRNWVFMQPEEIMGVPTTTEFLNLPEYDRDGAKKEKLSPLEQFFLREERRRTGIRNPRDRSDPSRRDNPIAGEANETADNEPRSDSRLDDKTDTNDKPLGGPFDHATSKTNSPGTTRTLADLLGASKEQDTESTERALTHKARMEEFRQMIGLPGAPFPSFNSKSLPSVNPLSPFAAVATPDRVAINPADLSNLGDQAPAASPSLNPARPAVPAMPGAFQANINPLANFNPGLSPAIGQSGTPILSAPPTVEPPKRQPATFSIPKRQF